MSVKRQGNWLGQQRVDVPHLRAIESAVAGDFDLLAGTILAGKAPLVVSGFRLVSTGITKAIDLQLAVADSALVHFLASESGSIFHVDADRAVEVLSTTNPRIIGSWTPLQVNYVGLDLARTADSTTTDLVQFLDANTLVETPKSVPLARTVDYRIVISTTEFDATPGIAPLARVELDTLGQIVEIRDSRKIFWRLGDGGTVPNPTSSFGWPGGRKETGLADSIGGDKAITSLKGWMDAVMSRLWEVGGGEYWYSPTQDHNVVMARTGAVFVSSGEYFEWSGTHLHWKGLSLVFSNSTATTNTINNVTVDTPGQTDLADGECIYVDVNRTTNASLDAVKTTLALLGAPTTPGSRWLIAWRSGSNIYVRDQSYAVGSAFKIATTSSAGDVKLSATDSAAVSPAKVATVDSVSFAAYAAGLTRGGDFFAGAGDLQIGALSANDHNVTLKTANTAYQTIISGIGNTGNAVCQIVNPTSKAVGNLTLRLSGWNGSTQIEETHQFEQDGAIGFRNVTATPATPTPTSTIPIRSKIYFKTNGVVSPGTRDLCLIMWWDGSTTQLGQSPTY